MTTTDRHRGTAVVTVEPPDDDRTEHLPGTVARRARGHGRDLLRREADVLRLLAGLPIVRLVSVEDDDGVTTLRTVRAGDTTAADPALTVRRRLQALAAGARALAALHRAGWAHGRPTADHLVIGSRGRVRWCSLGRATSLAADPEAAGRDRVVLMRTVWDLATTDGGRRLRRRLRTLGDAPDPGTLADVLDHPGRRTRLAGVVVGIAAAAVAGGVVRSDLVVAQPGPAPAQPPASNAVVVDGVRVRAGEPGEALAVVDLGCTGDPEVWLLRPGDGSIVAFDAATSGRASLPGRAIGRVADGVSWSPGVACGPPMVRRRDGSVVAAEAP